MMIINNLIITIKIVIIIIIIIINKVYKNGACIAALVECEKRTVRSRSTGTG
jgi:hypothetical protein